MRSKLSLFLASFLMIQMLCLPCTPASADDFDEDFDFDFDETPKKETKSVATKPQEKTKEPATKAEEKKEDSKTSIFSKFFPTKASETESEIEATEEPKKETTSQKSTKAPKKENKNISKKAAKLRNLLPKEKPTAQVAASNLDLLTRIRQGLPFSQDELDSWILSTADINYCFDNGQTMLLYLVARYSDTESLKMLIENGADLQTHCEPPYEALFIAAINNPSPQIIDVLTTNGANIVERDPEKNTALILAATFNPSADVVETLIDYGLRPDTTNRYGYNSLMLATYENGRIPVIQALLTNEAKIDAPDPEGHTPLMAAAIRGRDNVMQYLIRQGADFKATDKQGISVLDYYNKHY